jgi:hypothetical protein
MTCALFQKMLGEKLATNWIRFSKAVSRTIGNQCQASAPAFVKYASVRLLELSG